MSMQDNDQNKHDEPEILLDEVQKQAGEAPQEAASEQPQETTPDQEAEAQSNLDEAVKAAVKEQEDKYLRLLAEYDNYRKRSQKEKENAWATAKADAVKEFLPVYDNLERALKQETADEAYAKGVEMIMTQFKATLEKLGVSEIPALGETFHPNVHNAVMHIEDEDLGENTVAEVFQTGFQIGDKVIRHAMVKVAN